MKRLLAHQQVEHACAGLEVVNIDIAVDRFTNRSPGYCFVDLATPEEATKALEVLPGTTVLNRPIHVKPCVQKNSDQKTATQLQLTRWGTSTFSPVEQDPESLLLPIHRRRRLIVSGMPKPANQHTSDAELRELFRGFAVEAVSKVKWPRENVHGTSKDIQYAFVDLESAEEAERAMQQLNGAECWGGKVRIGVAQQAHDKILEREHWRGVTTMS
ncbi:uncharacterized protein N0V89_001585 [Didymosphaeria variabile]|uniref:RRM domain-containing protein n=1 Tax=Didymosphaeria variabile TaxID=1932322 RepID=A0A9W8XXI7_9PLEO|nr:uncharacterized protein N0V89_001585 [Didymosphaeria variabile]KAJ4361016.1 hypothetical protein N0V89_001585 [Didymosphaeria variabile]